MEEETGEKTGCQSAGSASPPKTWLPAKAVPVAVDSKAFSHPRVPAAILSKGRAWATVNKAAVGIAFTKAARTCSGLSPLPAADKVSVVAEGKDIGNELLGQGGRLSSLGEFG